MDLEHALEALKQAREQAELAKGSKQTMIEALKLSVAYQAFDERQEEWEGKAATLEAEIKRMALDLHALAAELPERVTVKMFTVVNEYDAAIAREWCLSNFRPALVLDTKTFENSVKAGHIPGQIATTSKEARAQIAKNL